ncbi:branched-chain amino acid ABC transporter permease [Aquabacterium sp.]|jgi:branched-chain amino acid transport system permease protein|uniref:branched-chain amino acid ABC transporter permease n=1 Tax=Aquabacterium sp. TaxID=1872578 RepID=UPI0011D9160A|nr:branched-chain amino acid ABC transporter permease [Aquabacterium sp.]MBP6612642.1 branched-chain amino acid ABC transporter permease [Aquabacterium sp.]MBP6614868.1 branched-chain amino acid ABC transporter permease [Aquabacterium sp.]MBP7502322.1 branched-chain amino acid ABC transporter permease [Aquabacterium sp.]MCC6219421.1 branched-chain amino acid ABC transporter permease [Aquabacterium sp.]MDD2976205.1 branched-chain amino acid ABC transporter permease [Aquabacterium sp.]
MKLLQGKTGWALLIALALVFPYMVSNTYFLSVMTQSYIFAIAALGLNLITGYTGQFNLAHGGFMAIGAYAVGLLTTDYQWGFWTAFAAAGAICGVIGYLVGVISLRMTGHVFSIFTLCVGYIIYLLIEKWEVVTHGAVGVMGIPAPTGFGGLEFDSAKGQYYLVLVFLIVGAYIMHRIVHSLLGRSFVAVRNSEALAEALGIPLARTKRLAFVLSVIYAGLAGGLYAGVVRFLGPDLAATHHTFELVMFMLVGGIGTILGPILGSILVPWLTQSLQFLQDYRMVVFGPVLILLLIFVPNGIVGTILHRRARRAAALREQAQAATAPAAASSNPTGARHA